MLLYGVQVSRCWQQGTAEVALCRTQLVSVSSAVDPLQDTAELISEAGGTSVKAYLRKGKMGNGGEE